MQVAPRSPEHTFSGCIGAHDPAVTVDQDDGVRKRRELRFHRLDATPSSGTRSPRDLPNFGLSSIGVGNFRDDRSLALRIARDADRHFHRNTVAILVHMVDDDGADAFAMLESCEQRVFTLEIFGGDQATDRQSQYFRGAIAEQVLGARIPSNDDPVGVACNNHAF